MLDLSSLPVTKTTQYLLSDINDFCPESAEKTKVCTSSPPPPVIYTPERKRRKMGVVRKCLLDSIVMYLYSRGQKATSPEDRDSFTLALAILGAARRDEPDPFTSASYAAFGMPFNRYLKRRAEAQRILHQELVACIPDYDPTEGRHANVVKTSGERGPETQSGRVYEMPRSAEPAERKPVRPLPRKSETVG